MRQRQPRVKDPKRLAAVQLMPCCICGATDVEAAHIRMGSIEHGKRQTGMGERPDDRWTVPLCVAHHREQHTMSERAFWGRYGLDPFELV